MSKPPGGGEARQADTLVKSAVSRGMANAVSAVCVHPPSMFSSRNSRDAQRVGRVGASRREEAGMVRGWDQGRIRVRVLYQLCLLPLESRGGR